MQATIREKLASCDIDVPVLALGGGTIDPKPPSAEMTDDFEELWEFVCAAQPLDTTRIQPFEGADVKWQKLIDSRDEAEAKAKAALIYLAVLFKLFLLTTLLFWRHMMLPAWLSLLLFNFPGLLDECCIVGAFVYWVGPMDTFYSLKHAYVTWVQPKIAPYIEQYVSSVSGGVSSKKKED